MHISVACTCFLMMMIESSYADDRLHFTEVTLIPTRNGVFTSESPDRTRIEVRNPDSTSNPRLWDSAIKITDANISTCTTRNYLLKKIYSDDINKMLLIVHTSGASTYLSLIGFSCVQKFPERKLTTSSVSVVDAQVVSSPFCLQVARGELRCYSASVFSLSKSTGFEFEEEQSKLKTKEVFGVEFVGSKTFKYSEPSVSNQKGDR